MSSIARLPESLPIFPLTGVLLLPRGRLPLNIFEPRYINMMDDALGSDRLIGMVQPRNADAGGTNPPVFSVGCAGRITQFTEDGEHYRLTLTGIARFTIQDEVATMRGYRRVVPDWSNYHNDFREDSPPSLDRPRLMAGVKAFFQLQGLSTDWSAIEQAPDDRLITSLAMGCPFDPAEKQALLEAPDLAERAQLLIGLMEMAVLMRSPDGGSARH